MESGEGIVNELKERKNEFKVKIMRREMGGEEEEGEKGEKERREEYMAVI